MSYTKNSSPKTIENYSLWIKRFIQFSWDVDVSKIKLIHIQDFRSKLIKQWLSPKTVNYHVIALRSFFKFLLRNDVDVLSPDKLDLAKIPQRQVSFLQKEQVDDLINSPLITSDKIKLQNLRDSAIISTLYWTWLRVTELISLKRSSVEIKGNQFSVRWKWSKVRPIFLTKDAKEKINKYLQERVDDSDFLFISLSANSYWQPLSRNSVESMIKKYAKLSWIKGKVTPHTLRHTYATTLLRNGADIRSVQMLLWHSSIQTTQIYTHVDDKYLQKVHNLLEEKTDKNSEFIVDDVDINKLLIDD